MNWNYRVLKQEINGEIYFGIHEVYYDEIGQIISCTEKSMIPLCNKIEDINYEFELMKDALKEDIIDSKSFQ